MTTNPPLDIGSVSLSGVTLIEASAGTGKTYALAALFVRLLLESELRVDEILVVTYTRAATAELRVRIRKRIVQAIEALDEMAAVDDELLRDLVERAQQTGQTARKRAQLLDALRCFDEAAIFTIHGFCQRILTRYAFESGAPFDTELNEGQALLIEEVVCDFWAQRMAAASELFVSALDKHRLTPQSAANLVKRALPHPRLAVDPPGSTPDTEVLERKYLAARARIVPLWAAHAEEVERLLRESGLKRNRFSDKAIRDKYLPALAGLASFTASDLPAWIEHLTPAQLRDCCKQGYSPPSHAVFDACDQLWQAASQLCAAIDQQVYAFCHALLAYTRTELARRGEQLGRMGFEDLLLRLREALEGERGEALIEIVRKTYRAALIDEFQDTDPVQLDVFRRIYTARAPSPSPSRPALFLIGDPKQAIYAFRGADIFAYLAAARQTAERVLSLAVNRRSDPSVVRAANAIFMRAREPFVFSEIQYQPVSPAPTARDLLPGPALQFLLLERPPDAPARPLEKAELEEQLPARIAAEISQLLAAGESLDGQAVEPRHIAVLCRTNAQAFAVQVALREARIPAVLDGDSSVFDSPMAEELARWLWAMAEPADASRVRSALATHGFAKTAEDLLALDRDEVAWDHWVARFHELQQLWQTRGFMRALCALCDAHDVAKNLLALPDGERRYTDLWHLAELLHEEALRTRKGPRALLDFFRRVRAGESERIGMALEDVQVRLESDAHAVTLTTIHKSKGLEYPIVYCPYLWALGGLHMSEKRTPLFHDRDDDDRPTLLLPRRGDVPAAAKAAAEREALAEHARLLYVALTRAKHRVNLVWGAAKDFHQSVLAYLLHQPPGVAGEALAQATATRAQALSDEELRADLMQLAAAADGGIGIRPLSAAGEGPRPRAFGALEPSRRLEPLQAKVAAEPQRISSFSSLSGSELGRVSSEPAEGESDALDHDATSAVLTTPSLLDAARAPIVLADFPAGANSGHLIHAIYEHADFQVREPAALAPQIASALSDYGVDAVWSPPLSAAIFESLHTPLAPAGGALPSLSSVAAAQRRNELEFVFPVARSAGALPLSAASLGRLLREHARNPHEQRYAERLRGLRFAPLAGFLRGFIDVVVEHEGRYYVIDYKSNLLGTHAADYRRERLEVVMRHHHYPLQYLLYAVAVHRYLALRLRGYDYARHFGGVYYLFVRGMSPRHEPGSGVLFDCPPRALIEALSAWLDKPELAA